MALRQGVTGLRPVIIKPVKNIDMATRQGLGFYVQILRHAIHVLAQAQTFMGARFTSGSAGPVDIQSALAPDTDVRIVDKSPLSPCQITGPPNRLAGLESIAYPGGFL